MQTAEKILLEIVAVLLFISLWLSCEVILLCVKGLPKKGKFHSRPK